VKRREFTILLGGVAAAWPLAVRAQSSLPVVGFIRDGTADANARYVAAFRKGLNETGFVEGQNVMIEYHWLDGQYNGLPELVADLVRRRVAVIATPGALACGQSCNNDDPDRLRGSERPGQDWPCRQPRPARRQRDRHQLFQRGGDRKAVADAA
jgi:hypothetical protein